MCKCTPAGHEVHHPQLQQESIFWTVFAEWFRFGGIFRRSGRATTKKGRQLFWQKKVHPQTKSWLRLWSPAPTCAAPMTCIFIFTQAREHQVIITALVLSLSQRSIPAVIVQFCVIRTVLTITALITVELTSAVTVINTGVIRCMRDLVSNTACTLGVKPGFQKMGFGGEWRGASLPRHCTEIKGRCSLRIFRFKN